MAATPCLQGIPVKSHTLQLHVFLTKSTTCLSLSLSISFTNLPDGIVQKPLDSTFIFSNLSYMFGHNLLPYFSMPILFMYSLPISLTLIHSSIDNIGLSLAITIIELKLSLKLFTKQSVKTLGKSGIWSTVQDLYLQDTSKFLHPNS
ncbi:hypothetical protein ACJW31_11G052800 [Castanea mollissima]